MTRKVTSPTIIRLSDFIVICCLARIIVRKFDGPPVCFSIHLSLSQPVPEQSRPNNYTQTLRGCACVTLSKQGEIIPKQRCWKFNSNLQSGSDEFWRSQIDSVCALSCTNEKRYTENSPDFNILVSAHTGAFFSPSFRFQSGWKLSYVCWPAGKISREGGAVGMISTARRSLARSDRRFSTGCWLNSPLELCDPMGQRERDMCVPYFYTALLVFWEAILALMGRPPVRSFLITPITSLSQIALKLCPRVIGYGKLLVHAKMINGM